MDPPHSANGDISAAATSFNYGQLWPTEAPRLRQLIEELDEAVVGDVVRREVAYENFLKIIDHYQEQPHVIDAYLEEMIAALLAKGRKKDNTDLLTNQAFTYIYLITKMRGYKVVIRYFPHEVSDLAPILAMLEVREVMCFLAESWDRSAILL